MNRKPEYSQEFMLSFGGLSLGDHVFDYSVDQSFFEQFESFEMETADLQIQVELSRQSTMLVFHFNISGKIGTFCDRCNDPLTLDLKSRDRLIVKFGDETLEETDEIAVLPETETRLNVAPFIYEFVVLALPARKVHDPKDCNPKVMELLSEHFEEIEEDEEEVDPRWAALKKLK